MRLEKVVIGLDLGEHSTEVAKWIADSFAPEAEIILAHAVDVPRTPSFFRRAAPSEAEIVAAATDFADVRLREIALFLTARSVRTEVCIGQPHEEISKLAADVGADLLVIGPHGGRPRPWKFLGTTAERIVRNTRTSVLVASGRHHDVPRHVLVAVDDGPAASAVLEMAKSVADAFASSVTVVHVLKDPSPTQVLSIAASTIRNDADRVASAAADLLSEATRWLETTATAGLGTVRTEAIVTRGKPGDAIVDTSHEIGADLIILGRRGTGSVMPALLGSTVSTVLHGSDCPVLVVVEHESSWDDSESLEMGT